MMLSIGMSSLVNVKVIPAAAHPIPIPDFPSVLPPGQASFDLGRGGFRAVEIHGLADDVSAVLCAAGEFVVVRLATADGAGNHGAKLLPDAVSFAHQCFRGVFPLPHAPGAGAADIRFLRRKIPDTLPPVRNC